MAALIAACAGGLVLGHCLTLLVAVAFARRKAGQHAKGLVTVSRASAPERHGPVKLWTRLGGIFSRFGVMNLILVVVGASAALFTYEMIELFKQYAAIPDNLCICFFSLIGGECGVMGWIKTTKERKQERKWQEQDRQRDRLPPAGGTDLPKG